MPFILDIADDVVITAEECAANLAVTGFHPDDPDELAHAARLLRRLGNNRDFLADLMVAELAAGAGDDRSDHVRRQNIWHNSRRKLAECGPRPGVDIKRRSCGGASGDVRWSSV